MVKIRTIAGHKIESDNSRTHKEERERELKKLSKIFKKNKDVKIEYSNTDHWVRVDGVTYNAYSREDIERIMKECRS